MKNQSNINGKLNNFQIDNHNNANPLGYSSSNSGFKYEVASRNLNFSNMKENINNHVVEKKQLKRASSISDKDNDINNASDHFSRFPTINLNNEKSNFNINHKSNIKDNDKYLEKEFPTSVDRNYTRTKKSGKVDSTRINVGTNNEHFMNNRQHIRNIDNNFENRNKAQNEFNNKSYSNIFEPGYPNIISIFKDRRIKYALILCFSGILFIFLALAVSAATSDKIYGNVYVEDFKVGGLTKEEAKQLLIEKYVKVNENNQIILRADGKQQQFKLKDVKIKYDIDSAVEDAYKAGRNENIFSQTLGQFTCNKKINIKFDYDKRIVEQAVDNLYGQIYVGKKESEFTKENRIIRLRSGISGKEFDKQEVYNKIIKMLSDGKSGIVDINIKVDSPTLLDPEQLYTQITKEPKNASITVNGRSYSIIPSEDGVKIEKTDLERAIMELNQKEGAEALVPYAVVPPAINTEKFRTSIFTQKLSEFTSKFSVDITNEISRNRYTNMKVASEKLNGIIISPRQEFSFNGTVGKRTPEAGFQKAYVYTIGKGKDVDYGGGVCQVATTLHVAALLADYPITERHEHYYKIDDELMGLDSTVSFGAYDMKFLNNTDWPIRIESSITDRELTFRLIGTQTDPTKEIKLEPKKVQEIPSTETQQKEDPELPRGQVRQEKGYEGSVYETYKQIWRNGKMENSIHLYTSKYQPYPAITYIGTGDNLPFNPLNPLR